MASIPAPGQRLRVAIVAPSLRILGGQSVQADALRRAWSADADVEPVFVPVNPQPPRGLRWLLAIKYLRTLITELIYLPQLVRKLSQVDVAHVFSASYSSFLLAPLPAILVARWFNKPVVLNYHSGEAADHLRRSKLARAILARVDRIVVQSPYLREVFGQYGLATTIVPNTIDFERFRFRARTAIAPRLLSTRNFEPHYNVACTIKAFRLVKDRYPAATLTVVGFGSEEPALRALTESLGLTDVTFVGRVPPEDMGRYYDAADVFVQTPNIDNMPLSVLEAFAAGLPVVSTEAGGVPAILRDGKEGLLAPLNDHRAVAAQTIRLLEDNQLAPAVVAAAFDSCRKYEWRNVRDQWLTVYNGVAPAVPSRRASTKSRIVVFMTSFEPGGTERQMIQLIRRLDRGHFEVHVACFHRRGAWLPLVEQAADSVVEFPVHGFTRPSTLRQLFAFARWCRQLRPVALHCTDFYTNVFGLVGGAIADVPLRIGSRRDINPGRSAAMIALQRAAYCCANIVVANSRAAAARLRRERMPARRIAVVHNGIDLSDVHARPPRPGITRAIVVANLRPEKAHRVLIAAAPAVLKKHPAMTFTIVGDGPLRDALRYACEDSGVSAAFEFLGHREDVARLLAASDLFVLPSISEAAPNAVIEAMAAGLPVVACAVGGNREMVQHGRTGVLVPPDDAAALAAAINAFVDDPAAANAMGMAGRDVIRQAYGYERMVSAFEALYAPASSIDAKKRCPQPELAA